jgi:hypothetical protein
MALQKNDVQRDVVNSEALGEEPTREDLSQTADTEELGFPGAHPLSSDDVAVTWRAGRKDVVSKSHRWNLSSQSEAAIAGDFLPNQTSTTRATRRSPTG